MVCGAEMWDAAYMSERAPNPFQIFIAKAIEQLPKSRNFYDRQLQEMLGTTGKPLYDAQRKGGAPKRETIKAMAAVLQQPLDLLMRAADGEAVEPLPAMTRSRVPASEPDQQPTHSEGAGETVGIVQLDLSLAMGPGTLIEDFVESEVVGFDLSILRRITRTPSDRLRFVTGIGTSHEPKFQSSDQFLIDINEKRLTRMDGYYWITFDGAHALKRLRPLGSGMMQIISDNPDFTPMDVAANEVRIEGRAIWFARGL